MENKIIEDKGNDDHEEEDYEDNITEVVEPIPPTEHPNNIEDIYQNFELKKVEARTSENFTQLTFQEMLTIYQNIWNTTAPVPKDRSMIVETGDSQTLRHVLSPLNVVLETLRTLSSVRRSSCNTCNNYNCND